MDASEVLDQILSGMKKVSIDAVARALNDANVPFVVVGGIAVIHHGYGRATQDLDLVVRLEKEVIQRAFRALGGIGYRPAVPVTAEQFGDATVRAAWRQNKGMKVLKFWSDEHRDTPIDVFTEEPFDFGHEYMAADKLESAPGVTMRIVSLATLLAMKRAAGRPQDLADIDELNVLHGGPSSYDRKP